MSQTYRIGDLATLLAVPVETIRYYERETLLPKPARSDANYRIYTSFERDRLEFILNCRALDMTLQDIRSLLQLRDSPEGGCGGVNDMLDRHIEHVSKRIRVLGDLQSQLKVLRLRCDTPQASKHCGILQGIAEVSKSRRRSTTSAGPCANQKRP